MKTVKEKVKALLKSSPHLRDDDNKLIATVYYYEVGNKIHDMTGYDFLQLFASGKLPSPESIRRVRQKLQEKHPDLRGEKAGARYAEEVDVRNNIHGL